MEVGLCIESVSWNLRPRGSPLATHVPKVSCISSFPRESTCKANNRNGGRIGILNRVLGHSIDVVIILSAVYGRRFNEWHDFEKYTKFVCARALRSSVKMLALRKERHIYR